MVHTHYESESLDDLSALLVAHLPRRSQRHTAPIFPHQWHLANHTGPEHLLDLAPTAAAAAAVATSTAAVVAKSPATDAKSTAAVVMTSMAAVVTTPVAMVVAAAAEIAMAAAVEMMTAVAAEMAAAVAAEIAAVDASLATAAVAAGVAAVVVVAAADLSATQNVMHVLPAIHLPAEIQHPSTHLLHADHQSMASHHHTCVNNEAQHTHSYPISPLWDSEPPCLTHLRYPVPTCTMTLRHHLCPATV